MAAPNVNAAQAEHPEDQESVKLRLAEIVHEARKIARKHLDPHAAPEEKVKMVRDLHDKAADLHSFLRPLSITRPWPTGDRILGLLKSIQYTTRQPGKFADQMQRRKWVHRSLLKDANDLASLAGITSAIENETVRRSPARPRIVVVRPRATQFEEDPLLTLKEVGTILNVHPRTVSRMFFDYPGVINIGEGVKRKLRIPKSALVRYINERRVW
jgi:hypothetical protein